MNNNVSIKTIVSNIQEVCQVRQFAELSCRGCKYYGKSCNRAIEILKNSVTRPAEITLSDPKKLNVE